MGTVTVVISYCCHLRGRRRPTRTPFWHAPLSRSPVVASPLLLLSHPLVSFPIMLMKDEQRCLLEAKLAEVEALLSSKTQSLGDQVCTCGQQGAPLFPSLASLPLRVVNAVPRWHALCLRGRRLFEREAKDRTSHESIARGGRGCFAARRPAGPICTTFLCM